MINSTKDTLNNRCKIETRGVGIKFGTVFAIFDLHEIRTSSHKQLTFSDAAFIAYVNTCK